MAGGWVVNVCVSMDRDVCGRDTAHLYMAQLCKKKRLQGQHAWRSAVHVDLRDWRMAGPRLQERERERERGRAVFRPLWDCGGRRLDV